MSEVLTAEMARRLVRYEPETGKLFWLPRPREMFACDFSWKVFDTQFARGEAFTSDNGVGYRQGAILGRPYKAHRVAWLIQSGEWPTEHIDHINGVRDDNRWGNLRLAPGSVNQQNSRRRSNNTSGFTGVSWVTKERKWYAQIVVNGAHISLGLHKSFNAAVAAREAANRKYGFSARHGAPE